MSQALILILHATGDITVICSLLSRVVLQQGHPIYLYHVNCNWAILFTEMFIWNNQGTIWNMKPGVHLWWIFMPFRTKHYSDEEPIKYPITKSQCKYYADELPINYLVTKLQLKHYANKQPIKFPITKIQLKHYIYANKHPINYPISKLQLKHYADEHP